MKNQEQVFKSDNLLSIAKFCAGQILARWQGAMVALAVGDKLAPWVVVAEQTKGGLVLRVFRKDSQREG